MYDLSTSSTKILRMLFPRTEWSLRLDYRFGRAKRLCRSG